MAGQSNSSEGALPGEYVLHRIAWLTLVIGFLGAAIALAMHRPDWVKGLIGGTLLGWLNFRWLKRGILAMIRSVAPAGPKATSSDSLETIENRPNTAGSPAPTFIFMLFRYGLLGLGVYVIFDYLHVPLVSIGLGLCALGAATIAASVWEVLKPAA
jgi:hypothetical protein